MIESLSPFAQAAPDLARLGYHVLPILPPTAAHGGKGKAPGEFSMGGWRGMPKWQALRDSAPSAFQMGLWNRFPDSNIGLVLGSPIGQDRLIAVDVDTVDPDILRDILGAIPYSPMVKRGAKGETRFYRASPDIKSTPYDDEVTKAADKEAGVLKGVYRLVDLLTGFDTRQTVCPPSVHPDGPVYTWLAGPVPAADLPHFTAEDLEVLEETLATHGWLPAEQRAVRVKRVTDGPLPDADDYFAETKITALNNLDAWVHDLDVYGLRPARGGYEAVATWRPSSTGQPIASRKRNLSIQANGVKDFGSNWTGSAIDLVMEAQNLSQGDATTWLRTRLGLDGEDIVLDLTPKRSTGIPVAPPKATVMLDGVPFRSAIAATIVSPPAVAPVAAPWEPAPAPKPASRAPVANSTELPDHLTRVPGLVGFITDWIVASAKRPQRGLALGSAVTLVGTAAGRKVAGPTDSGTHLYVLAIAPTGSGKDHPLKCVGRILTASTMRQHNGPSQFMSMSALINTLVREPLTLSAMDEFGSFLKRVNGAKAGNHEQAISGMMRQAWGSSFEEIETPAYAQASSRTIVSPAFSLYGASTAEEFYAAVEGDDVFNGFLNRFLTIPTKLRPAAQKPQCSVFEIPEAITNGMVSIYNIGGAMLAATSHNGQASPPTLTVPWASPRAEEVYDKFGVALEARESEAAFLSRTHEMSVRLATIRAIGISTLSPKVTVEDIEWGRDLALWSAERMMADATDYMSVNEYQREVQSVHRIIKESGKITKRDLQQRIKHRIKGPQLNAILAALVEAGDVRQGEGERPVSGGKPATIYFSNTT